MAVGAVGAGDGVSGRFWWCGTTSMWEGGRVRGGLVGALILLFVAAAGCSSAAELASTTSSASPVTSEPTGVAPTGTLAPTTTGVTPTTAAEPPPVPGEALIAQLGLVGAATLTDEDAVAALGMLDAYRFELLRKSPGFSATSTYRQTWVLADGSKPEPDPLPRIANVTVLESGDVWAEYANGDWHRFDATAGVHQGLYANPIDGSPSSLAYRGTPNIPDFSNQIRHQPMEPLGSTLDFGGLRPWDAAKIEVRSAAFEGNAAIEVTVETERLGLQRKLVDLGSGLIVDYQSTQQDANGTSGEYSSLTDVATASVLPVSVAPPLPDGVEWEPLWSPVDSSPTTVREAREAFGSGLILPRSAVDSGVISMEHSADSGGSRGLVSVDDPDGGVRSVRVQYAEPVGLLRTVVNVFTYRPGPDGVVPDEFEHVEDRLCPRPCSPPPSAPPSLLVPESGALAGIPFFGENGNFGVMVDGVHVTIEAPTTSEALAVANSLTVVDRASTPTAHDTAADEGLLPSRLTPTP